MPGCPAKTGKEHDRYVVCWLCDNTAHAKCAGVNGRVADLIAEDKGLRWCCTKCRQTDIDIYNVFKHARRAFSDVGKELQALALKFAEYDRVFNTFKCLSSPPRTPQTPREEAGAPSSVDIHDVDESEDLLLLSPNPDTQPPPITAALPELPNRQQPKEKARPPKIIVSRDSAPQNTLPQSSGNTSQENVVATTSAAAQLAQTVPKPLKVVAPKKAIFVSRLSPDTTVDDIKHYINSKASKNLDLNISKFNFAYSRIKASFKIHVPSESFGDIVNPTFWPPNTIVHEYVYKNPPPIDTSTVSLRNTGANTASNIVSNPKN